MHVLATFVVNLEDYKTNFLKLFTLLTYKEDRKIRPVFSNFYKQIENSKRSYDAKVGLPVWTSEPCHRAAS